MYGVGGARAPRPCEGKPGACDQRGDEVAQAMLAVTDERAHGSGRPAIVKAYNTVRGGAARHIKDAPPGLGGIVQEHAIQWHAARQQA